MHRGYIKYWRSSVDNPLYFSEPFTKWQAWSDLLLLASYRDHVCHVRKIPVNLEPGQVLVAEDFLAQRWSWSRGKVRRFLSYLESKTVQQIIQHKTNVCTIVSIVNWELYQATIIEDGTAYGTADGTADGPQTVQQTDTQKKGNKGKERKDRKDRKDKRIQERDISPEEYIEKYSPQTQAYQSMREKRKGARNDSDC